MREQFRIADGEELGYDDPEPHAHSIEFRINGEDAGRNFMPAPGTVTKLVVPEGPGVRWDAGMVEGDTIAGAFDSMVAKLIVTGRTRQQALERSRRVLDELVIEGVATVAPFHAKVVRDPAFAPADPDEKFTVHTRWIETEFDNDIPAYGGGSADAPEAEERQTITVEVGGKRLQVSLPAGLSLGGGGAAGAGAAKKKAPRRSGAAKGGAGASGDSLTAPMQGTIVKIAVEEGQTVAEGVDRLGARADPHQSGVDDLLRKGAVLGEEAVARVHGVRPGLLGNLDELVLQQIGVARCAPTQRIGLVGDLDVEGVPVGLGIDGDGPDAVVLAGAGDTDGDLATIGDEDFADGHVSDSIGLDCLPSRWWGRGRPRPPTLC